MYRRFLIFFLVTACLSAFSQKRAVKQVDVDRGWSRNTVNTVIFRKNSLFTFRDTQFIAFYNDKKQMVLGKRKVGREKWALRETGFTGNTNDAHNSISLIIDGDGYIHVSWDHHNNELRYSRGLSPGSLELTAKQAMVGKEEKLVTYPEFFKMPNGDLIFFYRHGGSGQGNLILNKYDLKSQRWIRMHDNLISGQGERNAYWQSFVDQKGTIHVSWVWRESPDVASNHDLGYARSRDGGLTWEKTSGAKYSLPISQDNAEYAIRIPQGSELINQTSMSADKRGNPFIATYFREADSKVPQYHIVYYNGEGWKSVNLNFRTSGFSLSGGGTKKIPISRPQLVLNRGGSRTRGWLIFRDEERAARVSAVEISHFARPRWRVFDLTQISVGAWEPTYDPELWKVKGILNLFLQNVVQVDGEGLANSPSEMIKVLEWKPGY